MDNIDFIVECMATNNINPNIQKVQTLHRLKLAAFWNIKAGSNVLEIGCGQGDTTAVLAYMVGEKGLVHGVDIAHPSYGSPITLGESANFLKKSKLSKQIKIDFETDVLSPKIDFPDHFFDYIVLSHCSWYFKSHEELTELLKKVRKWGKQLCYAEWDTRIKTMEQWPHFMAILIQAQYECFKESSLSNLRTLFTPADVVSIAETAGWHVKCDKSISSNDLQDGKWELDTTLNGYQLELDEADNIPDKMKSLIRSQVKLLESSMIDDIRPMSTYAFIAD